MAKNAKPKINAEAACENAHLMAQDLVTRKVKRCRVRMALPVGIKGLRSGGSDRVQLRLRAGLSQQGE